LFPFQLPVFIPRAILRAISKTLAALRIHDAPPRIRSGDDGISKFVRLTFPMTFVTTPLIANIFLLAILAIGRREVHDGTIGANNIAPYDIMLFFISLAYIAISIDASGLIRYLAYRVLQSGGNAGHRLYLSLYTFFFALTAAIGNDPIILSGTPFLAYMTRVSANIGHPRAWIYSQFSVANIASAILVSSNPTNLVVAGAFNIRFINRVA
jgi:Na+/H+ antiporter NhaD/arsenite permease-like protein